MTADSHEELDLHDMWAGCSGIGWLAPDFRCPGCESCDQHEEADLGGEAGH